MPAGGAAMSEATANPSDIVVPGTCTVPLTYRGPLVHRGVGISRETYGKAWTLRLANGVWTLADHNGDEVHSFSQKGLHGKVAFPGSLPGNKDLCLVGLGADSLLRAGPGVARRAQALRRAE